MYADRHIDRVANSTIGLLIVCHKDSFRQLLAWNSFQGHTYTATGELLTQYLLNQIFKYGLLYTGHSFLIRLVSNSAAFYQ